MSEYDRIIERRLDHGIVRYIETYQGIQAKGKTYTHSECERRLQAAWRGTMRWFSRTLRTRTTWDEADMNKYEINQMRYVVDEMQTYVEIVQRELDRLEGKDRRAERVKALQEVSGRTPEEAALFLAKAAQLEGEAT